MSSDVSDSEFEGFTPEDVQEAVEKGENASELSSDESDIDISEVSSDDEYFESESDQDLQDVIQNLTEEWSPDVTPIRNPVFTGDRP